MSVTAPSRTAYERKRQVSILRETRPGEKKVAVLPAGVEKFNDAGYEVLVSCGAGFGLAISDAEYEAAGARLVSQEEAWTLSPYVLKSKAPTQEEYVFLRGGLHLCANFHAEGNPALTRALLANRVNAYTYEFFRDERGGYPLAVAGAEIAGRLAVIYAAYLLQRSQGGRGLLLPHVPGAPKVRVLIIGYGNAGGAAARLALAMGADVTVLGRSLAGLRKFQGTVGEGLRCLVNTPTVLAQEIRAADVVIGALLISTHDTPEMIGPELVKAMPKGSVLVDVTCGYGRGYLPTFDRFSTLEEPSYEKSGVIHVKIDNMSSAVPISTVHAVNAVSLPYLIALGDAIYDGNNDASIMDRFGRLTFDGRITNPILDDLFRASA